MGNFVKIDNQWTQYGNIYKKINGTWTLQSNSLPSVMSDSVYFYGGHVINEPVVVNLEIIGPESVTAETVQLSLQSEGNTISSGVTWAITSGSGYATINSSGLVTILSGANNSSIVVSATYSGNTETKTIVVTYLSGASSETTTETDVQGNTTTTTTVTNQDGSSSSSSVTYDTNGNPTSAQNEVVDTSGNESTQEITYQNGTPVVTGYTIDTTQNPSGGGLSTSTGIDTGVMVFDGHNWTATLKAKILFSDFTANTQYPIMNVSSRGDDNKLDGAFFLVTKKTSSLGSGVYDENGTQQSTTTSSNPTLQWRIQNYLGGSLQNGVDFYYKNGTRAYYTNRFGSKTASLTLTYKMTYTESNHQLVTEIYAADGTTILAKPRSEAVVTFTRTMSDIEFEIGKATNVSGTPLTTPIEVLDFEVRKTL